METSNKQFRLNLMQKVTEVFFVMENRLNEKNYSIIHYGLNIRNFINFKFRDLLALQRKLHIEKNTKLIGCVARHEKQKNIDTSNNDYKNDIEELIKKFNEEKDKYSKNVDNMNLII